MAKATPRTPSRRQSNRINRTSSTLAQSEDFIPSSSPPLATNGTAVNGTNAAEIRSTIEVVVAPSPAHKRAAYVKTESPAVSNVVDPASPMQIADSEQESDEPLAFKLTPKAPKNANTKKSTPKSKTPAKIVKGKSVKREADSDLESDAYSIETKVKSRTQGKTVNSSKGKGPAKAPSRKRTKISTLADSDSDFDEIMQAHIQASKEIASPAISNGSTSSATPRTRRKALASGLNTPATTVSVDLKDILSEHSSLSDEDQIADKDEFDDGSASEFGDSDLSDANSEVSLSVISSLTDSASATPQPVETISRRRGRRGAGASRADRKRLTWEEKNERALLEHHPELATVWKDLETSVPKIQPTRAVQPKAIKLQLLPFQLEGIDWMRKQELKPEFKGGILADEMGMGKTIQTVSLLVSEPRQKPNLVVAPAVALIQWKNEIEKYCGENVSVCVFHGSGRTDDVKKLKAFDIVLTTYGTLEYHYRRQAKGYTKNHVLRKEESILHKIKWHRVVLDEAHNIKDRTVGAAKAAFGLQADYRWSLTGTPLQNRVGELYSLVRFMAADPYSHYFCKKCPCKSLTWSFKDRKGCDDCGHKPMDHVCWWNNEILKPIQKYGSSGHGGVAFRKLRLLLDRIMLRRTREERNDELGLPPRILEVRRDFFNEEEEDLYMSLYNSVSRKFTTFVDQGVVLNNYANIFTLLTNMRQMADHPDLVLKKKISPGKVENTVCRICQEEAEDPIMSRCRHIFCRTCAEQYLETAGDEVPRCQACQALLSIDIQGPTYEPEETDDKALARLSIVDRIDMSRWRSSTKIEGLVEELDQARAAGEKCLVFSQFVNFLDLIEWRLKRAGYSCVKLDGKMTPEARDAAIQYFSTNSACSVFLISLKAGGVALNLTEASRVFIMDPWWNPAVQFQAADRVSRLGQKRPIRITLMIIENSLEQRILQLQEKKQHMADSALSRDDSALGRLTEEDLRYLFVL